MSTSQEYRYEFFATHPADADTEPGEILWLSENYMPDYLDEYQCEDYVRINVIWEGDESDVPIGIATRKHVIDEWVWTEF